MYRIFVTAEFDKSIAKITATDRKIIDKKISEYMAPQIKAEPHFGPNIKKLKGYNPDTWRYRIGRYRLFYVIDDNSLIISLLAIDQRKDAY